MFASPELMCCGAGHSLGGFAAATCLILCDRILTCTAFESPGLTTFYHRLAAQQGGEEFWRDRIISYLAIPNPINMCQKHLGRIIRCLLVACACHRIKASPSSAAAPQSGWTAPLGHCAVIVRAPPFTQGLHASKGHRLRL